eukprot:NODE_1117_length_1099_cov_90.514286_g854_i0.p1 GENE.NODE_1117_length_1099_cov_90.514286_g854_i0~~NODE_1117_length_1099_cov_90.514286_g854_i0.p1  ORF type:complete len:340 (+),score=72.17 NODE_1117_length_1099_cov_90.514286_g854_i0:77-1096(+)
MQSKRAHQKEQDDDDPFVQGSSYDYSDPFDLDADTESLRKNVLPSDVMLIPLSFCDFRTLLTITRVNRAWKEAADSDKVWKTLCKAKWGADLVKEHKEYFRHLGWKLTFFVGVCKTVLVNTPERHAVALVPYCGLTVRDMMHAMGIDKVHHFRISSPNWSDAMAAEVDEMEEDGEGCWPSLASSALCDILVEPFSTVYVEGIRRRDREKQLNARRDDDDDISTARDTQAKEAESQLRLSWNTAALARLQKRPKFLKKVSHYSSLCPPSSAPSANRRPGSAAAPPAARSALPTRPPSTTAGRGTTTVSHASGRTPAPAANRSTPSTTRPLPANPPARRKP